MNGVERESVSKHPFSRCFRVSGGRCGRRKKTERRERRDLPLAASLLPRRHLRLSSNPHLQRDIGYFDGSKATGGAAVAGKRSSRRRRRRLGPPSPRSRHGRPPSTSSSLASRRRPDRVMAEYGAVGFCAVAVRGCGCWRPILPAEQRAADMLSAPNGQHMVVMSV